MERRIIRIDRLGVAAAALLCAALLVAWPSAAPAAFTCESDLGAEHPGYGYDAPSTSTTSVANSRTDATADELATTGLPRSSPSSDQPRRVPKAGPRLLGPGTSFGRHVRPEKWQSAGGPRGSLDQRSMIRSGRSRLATIGGSRAGADRMDHPATAYYGRRGGYVVRNNRTGDIVQVSDRLDAYWQAPWDT